MALEKSDLTTISKYVRDSVQRLPPRAMKAVGIGRVLGTPEADTPPATDSSDRLATTSFVSRAIAALTTGVSSVFGRTGSVVAQSGDYTAAQVTNALDLSNVGTQTLTGTLTAGGLQIGGNALPGTEIGYNAEAATISITGTTSSAPTTIVTGSAYTFDGQPVLAHFHSPAVQSPSVAGATVDIGLYEGSTLVAILAQVKADSAANLQVPAAGFLRFTPTAGSHTYSIKAWASSTTGTPQVAGGVGSGGGFVPTILRFTKV